MAARPSSIRDLVTLRDMLRYAVSRFNAAGLVYGHGTDNAFDEAAFLILETLHLPIDRLDPFLDARLTTPERNLLAKRIEARVRTRKPAAYLTNSAYIQGVRFYVDERVIVPRSYIGELLFSELLGSGLLDAENIRSALDLCTGSGCLAILAALRFPQARVDAVDISAPALQVAKKNVAAHGLGDRVSLFKGDLFAPVKGRRYDLILSNPPYVAAKEMAALPKEYRHEPKLALAAGNDGLAVVQRILKQAGNHLTPQGGLICEIGTGREALEAAWPDLPFLWLESETSSGEVFWLPAASLL